MLTKIIEISEQAGQKILEIYNQSEFSIEFKQDNSPLTIADKLSNETIIGGLKSIDADIPIISEEGNNISFMERNNLNKFWLVDPLDGTKEFIKHNGEFTVNIALIENNTPVLGVVHIPVTGVTYYSANDIGSYIKTKSAIEKINVSKDSDNLVVVKSRSHSSEEEDKFYSNFNVSKVISKGSSLKICMLAEGLASLYYRAGPTMEWDTAAAHAILINAGGNIYNKDKKSLLSYNKLNFKNYGFIASAFALGN